MTASSGTSPTTNNQLDRTGKEHARDVQDLADLFAGRGRWADHPAGRVARGYNTARQQMELAQERADAEGLGWRDRRRPAKISKPPDRPSTGPATPG